MLLFAVSDAVWMSAIAAVITVAGIFQATVMFVVSAKLNKIDTKQGEMGTKVAAIEHHTNSLTERLERAATRVGEITGMERERARVAAENALIALGVLAEQQNPKTLADNVNEVKQDVKVVKDDVGEVKGDVKKIVD